VIAHPSFDPVTVRSGQCRLVSPDVREEGDIGGVDWIVNHAGCAARSPLRGLRDRRGNVRGFSASLHE
jgi:hypothetical protein